MATEEAVEAMLERARVEGFERFLSAPTVAVLMSTIPEQHSETMMALMKQAFATGVDRGAGLFLADVIRLMATESRR